MIKRKASRWICHRHLNLFAFAGVIVWGNFDFGHRDFNILFRDRRDKKGNQHVFAITKKETETDVGSTYALIKAYQSVLSNQKNRSLERSQKKNNVGSTHQINLRDKTVKTFLKEANTVFKEAIHLCETTFSYPACPIVSVHEINKLVVTFYHTLTTIYNWQYCLSVSAGTSTISNVTQMH
jgi:hypothetical protein